MSEITSRGKYNYVSSEILYCLEKIKFKQGANANWMRLALSQARNNNQPQ